MAIFAAMTLWCFGGFLSSIANDPGDVLPALFFTVFFGTAFAISCYLHLEAIRKRQQWRMQRYVEWILKRDLAPPESTDWEDFERQLTSTEFRRPSPPRNFP